MTETILVERQTGCIFPGDGEMARYARAFDWSHSRFGPPEQWPTSLRRAVDVTLLSSYASVLIWGAERRVLYNDFAIPFLDVGKHPACFGARVGECWADVWETLGPIVNEMFEAGAYAQAVDCVLLQTRATRTPYLHFAVHPVLSIVGDSVDGAACILTRVRFRDEFAPLRRSDREHELRIAAEEMVAQVSRRLRLEQQSLERLNEQLASERFEHQRIIEALRASEERSRRYFEVGLIGMATTSADKGILEVNEELCRLLGYDREELLTKSWVELTHPDDRAADLANFNRVLAGELEGYVLDKRWIRKDGTVIDTIMAVRCQRKDDGSVDYFVGLVQDITNRKKGERALAEARTEIARVTRATTMGELAASIAHEIKQPLAAVIANASACRRWLSASPPDLVEAKDAATRIIRDANRATEVITRIRTLLQRDPIERFPIDLAEVIAEVCSMVQDEIQHDAIVLRVEVAENISMPRADRVQVQQLLCNLVTNAIDSMKGILDRPRVLTIEVGQQDPATIVVRVRDTGIGVPAEDLDRVFDAFHTTKPDGVGMGLAISRSIVEAHEGTLRAELNPDHGLTMSFTLPLNAT